MKILRAMLLALPIIACGCTQEMYDQPRYEAFESSTLFPDGKSARRPVTGTVARGQLWHDDPFFTGQANGQLVKEIPSDPRTSQPFQVDLKTLQRGQERFDIFCSHCHGRTGYGDGMVVRRGFRKPPSFHTTRLREETPPGHYFDVITSGFKTMPQQGSRIPPADRWAIVAYIGALQTSQHVILSEAPEDILGKFEPSAQSALLECGDSSPLSLSNSVRSIAHRLRIRSDPATHTSSRKKAVTSYRTPQVRARNDE